MLSEDWKVNHSLWLFHYTWKVKSFEFEVWLIFGVLLGRILMLQFRCVHLTQRVTNIGPGLVDP